MKCILVCSYYNSTNVLDAWVLVQRITEPSQTTIMRSGKILCQCAHTQTHHRHTTNSNKPTTVCFWHIWTKAYCSHRHFSFSVLGKIGINEFKSMETSLDLAWIQAESNKLLIMSCCACAKGILYDVQSTCNKHTRKPNKSQKCASWMQTINHTGVVKPSIYTCIGNEIATKKSSYQKQDQN